MLIFSSMIDPYAVLGVSKSATQEEIKTAYRKLAKKLHPDLNPGNKSVENKFKEVNKAYELVGTPEARAKFDRGETQEQQEQAWRDHQQQAGRRRREGPYYYQTQGEPGSRYTGAFEGIDPEMFANIFGGAAGFEDVFGGRAGARADRGPRDQHYTMDVDFNTSVLGGEREITLPAGKRLRVKIPAGIKPGMKLRLAGQAESLGGEKKGDVYIEVNVLPSDVFRRVGDDDLEMDLSVPVTDAILGGEMRVPTVDGHVMLKVPVGVSTGARIRIRGKGIPRAGGARGDQYAVVKLVMPDRIDDQLQDAVRRWSERTQGGAARG